MARKDRVDPITILQENLIREITNASRENTLSIASIVGALEFIKHNLISGDFGKEDEDDEDDDDLD